jgi:hypothetical protein
MDSMRDFVESANKKDMILELLDKSFPMIPKESHDEMVELVFLKLGLMQHFRNNLAKDPDGTLKATAEQFGAEEDQVLDSFIFFFMVVESVWSQKLLAELIMKYKDDLDDIS